MATLKNKRELAAAIKESHEEYPRNNQSRDPTVSRINEDHITAVSEEIEGRLSKNVSGV